LSVQSFLTIVGAGSLTIVGAMGLSLVGAKACRVSVRALAIPDNFSHR
jgi:hypothetical protein